MSSADIKAFFAFVCLTIAGPADPEPPGQGWRQDVHAGVAQDLPDPRQRRLQRAQRRGAHHRHQPPPPRR